MFQYIPTIMVSIFLKLIQVSCRHFGAIPYMYYCVHVQVLLYTMIKHVLQLYIL